MTNTDSVHSNEAVTEPMEECNNDVTAQLATKESEEHMAGMKVVYEEFRNRPIIIRAHLYDISKADTSTVATASTSSTFKIIHFIRHGQGFHNLLADIATESGMTWRQFESSSSSSSNNNNTGSNQTNTVSTSSSITPKNNNPYMRPEVLDAPLTELGRKQAQQLNVEMIQKCTPIDCIYVSPHCRTLQTGLIAFQHFIHPTKVKVVPLMAHEFVREESGVHVCDQRRDISWQSMEFPQYDFHSYCPSDIDPLFHSQVRETKFQVAHRIYQFMEHLSTLEDVNHIAVVSHSGWLHILFNAIIQDDCHPKLKKWFQTGEMRSVQVEFIRK